MAGGPRALRIPNDFFSAPWIHVTVLYEHSNRCTAVDIITIFITTADIQGAVRSRANP
jgi:hypothetical protein